MSILVMDSSYIMLITYIANPLINQLLIPIFIVVTN